MTILLFVLGLFIGSFLGAYTYREPKNIPIEKGRSFCPKCKKQINWYDNIPVFSYLILGAKCRNCKKAISSRYPIIETITALLFSATYVFLPQITTALPWLPSNLLVQLVVLLVIVSLTMAILVIDFENQLIPDKFVFSIFGIVAANMVLNGFTPIYDYLATGFISGLFLLVIHLLTAGKGMGLGDVKLAIPIGLMLGPIGTIVWYFLSFIFGGVVGVFLLIFKNAGMKQKIAFGPFLIIGLYVYLVYSSQLKSLIFPYF